jgi:TrmH family RNA methyltransferase
MEMLPNKEVSTLRELVRSAEFRRTVGLFVVEGSHLVQTALEQIPSKVQSVLFAPDSDSSELERMALNAKVEIRGISQKNAEKISVTKTTQGVFAVVQMALSTGETPREFVALDEIQDPGNVGTIIRTALWFGVTRIIAGAGTADCYSPKVTRATQGAIFGVTIEVTDDLAERLRDLSVEGYRILGASLSEGSTNIRRVLIDSKYVLVLGNEAQGLSPEVEDACDELVRIDRIGRVESLNVGVSAGILLAKLTEVV